MYLMLNRSIKAVGAVVLGRPRWVSFCCSTHFRAGTETQTASAMNQLQVVLLVKNSEPHA
jgi:hypothetical protein